MYMVWSGQWLDVQQSCSFIQNYESIHQILNVKFETQIPCIRNILPYFYKLNFLKFENIKHWATLHKKWCRDWSGVLGVANAGKETTFVVLVVYASAAVAVHLQFFQVCAQYQTFHACQVWDHPHLRFELSGSKSYFQCRFLFIHLVCLNVTIAVSHFLEALALVAHHAHFHLPVVTNLIQNASFIIRAHQHSRKGQNLPTRFLWIFW